eukprot:2679461-Amphidinium_carterae.2
MTLCPYQEAPGRGTLVFIEVAAATFGPATFELMKYAKEKALEGDSYATTLLQYCVGELEESCACTHSGDEMDFDEELDDNPEPQAKMARKQTTEEAPPSVITFWHTLTPMSAMSGFTPRVILSSIDCTD